MALISDISSSDPIESSWGNAIRDATVQVTTSSARPGSPFEGQVIYETDTHKVMVHNGFGWIELANTVTGGAWSPTITQSSTRTGTTNLGLYQRTGTWVTAQLHWTSSATGSSDTLKVSYPGSFTPQGVALGELVIGSASIYQGSTWKNCQAIATSTGIAFLADEQSSYYSTLLVSGHKISAQLGFFV